MFKDKCFQIGFSFGITVGMVTGVILHSVHPLLMLIPAIGIGLVTIYMLDKKLGYDSGKSTQNEG